MSYQSPPAPPNILKDLRSMIEEKLKVHEKLLLNSSRQLEASHHEDEDEIYANIGSASMDDIMNISTTTGGTTIGRTSMLHEDDDGIAERATAWAKRVKEKREAQHRMFQQEEIKKLRPKPKINAHSAKLAEQHSKSYGGDVSHFLFSQAEEQRLHRQELVEDMLSSEVPAHPMITLKAAELVREGNISDRLYEDALARAATAASKAAISTAPSEAASSRAYDKDHTRALYENASDILRTRQERLKKEEMEAKLLARPTLSDGTQKIASQLDSTPMERLLKPKPLPGSPLISDEVTFQPKINQKSKKIMRVLQSPTRKGSKKDAFGRLHEEAVSRNERRKKISSVKSREERELVGCTFKPKLSKSKQSFRKTNEENNGGESVHSRLATWEARRNAKLERQRKEKEKLDNDPLAAGCTFAPKINKRSKAKSRVNTQRKARLSHKPSGGRSGIEKFLERQRRGREERERKKDTPHMNGSGWTGRTTVAKAPKLGSARRGERRKMDRQVRRNNLPREANEAALRAEQAEQAEARAAILAARERVSARALKAKRKGRTPPPSQSFAISHEREGRDSRYEINDAMPPPPPPALSPPYTDEGIVQNKEAENMASFDLAYLESIAANAAVHSAKSTTEIFDDGDSAEYQELANFPVLRNLIVGRRN